MPVPSVTVAFVALLSTIVNDSLDEIDQIRAFSVADHRTPTKALNARVQSKALDNRSVQHAILFKLLFRIVNRPFERSHAW